MKRKKSKIREILNKIIWSKNIPPKEYEVVFTHRGVPGNRKTVEIDKVRDVRSWYIVIDLSGEEFLIPLHRIIEIRHKNGRILWRKGVKE